MRVYILFATVLLSSYCYGLPIVTKFHYVSQGGAFYYNYAVSVITTPYGNNSVAAMPPYVSSAGYSYGPALCYLQYNSCSRPEHGVPAFAGDTWDTLAQKWTAVYGTTGEFVESFNVQPAAIKNKRYCMVVSSQAGSPSEYDPNWTTLQPQSCTTGTPTPTQCNITTTSPLIDYGAIDVNSINGATQNITASIACDQPANVQVSVVSNTIDLGHGVNSVITVNGQPNLSSLPVTQPTTIDIKSTLNANNPTPGAINGSAIIIINPL